MRLPISAPPGMPRPAQPRTRAAHDTDSHPRNTSTYNAHTSRSCAEWRGAARRGVESRTGAVAVDREGSCCRPPSSMPVPHFAPWLHFPSRLVEPDIQVSSVRLSQSLGTPLEA